MKKNKPIIFILVLLIIIFSISIFEKRSLEHNSKHLNTLVIDIRDSIQHENWNLSNNQLNSLYEAWDNNYSLFAFFIDHSELNCIENSLLNLSDYIEYQDKTLSIVETSKLYLFINNIIQKNSFKLVNIM